MSAEARLVELGIELPADSPPAGLYAPAVTSGDLVYLSGSGPARPGGGYVTGKVGLDEGGTVSLEEADAYDLTPLEEESAPLVAVPTAAPAAPLLPMTARSGASSAPKTLLHRKTVRAARTKTTRGKMSCWSMPL